MDRRWIKNLALSRFENGEWQTRDPSHTQFVAHARLLESVDELYRLIADSLEIFNLHSPPHKQLKLFKLARDQQSAPHGFSLLIRHLQVNVEAHQGQFQISATLHNGPQPPSIILGRFVPRHDEFGAIFWIDHLQQARGLEEMAKRIMKQALQLAYESCVLSS